MPPGEDPSGESFRGLVLQLRGRTGLTQRELAERIGVSVSSIQGWEAGHTYPSAASLQTLTEVALEVGGFATGREPEEARALWAAALRDAPRLRTPFDVAWFERIMRGRSAPVRPEPTRIVSSPPAPPGPPSTARTPRLQSWGEAPDVAGFLGRTSERDMLRRWVLDEGSRVVALLGLGGIGKTLLATRLAHDLAPSFERVFWRSLRDAPTPGEWLTEALAFLAPGDRDSDLTESSQIRRLLELLRDARCLLVLDNFQTVLQPGGRAGDFRAGYERYGALLQQMAEAPHRSCLIVTSREEPHILGPLRGEHGPVRMHALGGLQVEDGRALLSDKRLDGDEEMWQALIRRCGGNSLALKVVGEATGELFGGSIAEYLEFAATTSGVMVGEVRQLLGAQVQRLSALEQHLLRQMAVAREPVTLMELATDLGPHIGRGAALDAIEGLRRRSLLERTERGSLFSLHSVVLEYVTEQMIEDITHELELGEPDHLLRQPLVKATAKDYVRRSQERLIVGPILERLDEMRGRGWGAEQRLLSLLAEQRGRPVEEQGYGPGNLVNLLRLLRGNLRGVDLSGLSIRHAYLPDVEAQGASLAGAHLSETVIGEAFNYPSSLALSADGAYLAVGTASGEICRWRVADRTLLATMPGHIGPAWGVALSADGLLAASGGVDGTVRLWDAETGRPLATFLGHTGGVRSVALSGDGRLVASGGLDGVVRLSQVAAERPLLALEGHTGEVYSVALSGDGRLLASSSYDRTVRLWDAQSGRPLATLHGHTGLVVGVALSGDSRLVASASVDGTVRLWEVATGEPLATLHGHTGGVRGVALSGDGLLLVSGGFDGAVRLWETGTGQPISTLHGHTGGVLGVALGADGRLIASGSFNGSVRLWDAQAGLPLAILRGHTGGVRSVALAGDDRLVAGGSFDGTVRLWDAETGRSLATLRGHVGGVRSVALDLDGRLVASGGFDGTVRLWDTATGRALATLHGHTGGVYSVALGRDGRLVASASLDGTIRLWETATGQPLTILRGHSSGVYVVALGADGRLVASGGLDGMVRLWDAETGQSLATLPDHDGEVYAVALSADGRVVASGGLDATVRLWEVETGRPLTTLRGHVGAVYSVTLGVDGLLAISAGADGTVRLWDVKTGQPLATLRGHDSGVWGVVLGENGRLVASGGDDGTVRVWDAGSGTLERTLRPERRYEDLDITGLTGITEAQRGTLFALGAIEQGGQTPPPA